MFESAGSLTSNLQRGPECLAVPYEGSALIGVRYSGIGGLPEGAADAVRAWMHSRNLYGPCCLPGGVGLRPANQRAGAVEAT